MPQETRTVAPGPKAGTVRFESGQVCQPPRDWALLPPGDAGLTRRVKKSGPTWTVKEQRGRRSFSKGVWAPAATIAQHRSDLEAERSTEAYQRKRVGDKKRRDVKQVEYVADFRQSILTFLDFPLQYDALANAMATAVADHATPVGSGTVARTQRIPIEERAQAAVIAWMRHQTTAYDDMKIARVKGKRREVRRMLAERAHELLDCYRRGDMMEPKHCPLKRALG